MTITLYITRTGDMIQTGKPAEVTLEEYLKLAGHGSGALLWSCPQGLRRQRPETAGSAFFAALIATS